MQNTKLGLFLVGGWLAAVTACGGGEAASDDEDGGKGGTGGSATGAGGATGGTGGATGGASGKGGTGGATGGSGGSAAGSGGSGGSAAGTGGAGGTGGGAGAGPQPCDTSDFEWEDPGCPADSLRTFGDPVCSELYKCIVGYGCAGLACDSCIETVSVGYAMNDVCYQGITAAELHDLCVQEALSYAAGSGVCAPDV